MTNALGIAAVTAVLVDRLNEGVIGGAPVSTMPIISALPPSRFAPGGGTEPQNRLNLFLYRIDRNPGWANNCEPTRSSGGERISTPLLGVDLHYILSAYGVENYVAETLLGIGMQTMQLNPVLEREYILSALARQEFPSGFSTLLPQPLSEQVEQIRISHHRWSPEDEWRLWEALHAGLRPSATYMASAILIEPSVTVEELKPVEHRVVIAVPKNRPLVSAVLNEPGADEPTPRLRGSVLELTGSNLGGSVASENLSVQFGNRAGATPPDAVDDDRVRVTIPTDVLPGPIEVKLVRSVLPSQRHGDPEPPIRRFVPVENSRSLGIDLMAGFDDPGAPFEVNNLSPAGQPVEAEVVARFDFEIDPNQEVMLSLALGGQVTRFEAEPGSSSTEASFQISQVDVGIYTATLSVAGIDSTPSTDLQIGL